VATKSEFRDMNEATLRRVVLVPLLRAIGFHDVEELHGVTGYGKDIIG